MKVEVAKTAGFCMGVKRAVDITKNTASSSTSNDVYTLGELIHNKQVVNELEELGVRVAFEDPESGTVIIRAHGVTQQCKNRIREAGLELIDATCPHVLSSQKTIAEYSSQGATVLILGDSKHPEVVGLCGYAGGDVLVIGSKEECENLSMPEEFLFIAQTTFSMELFNVISSELKVRFPNCKIVNSICSATEKRQAEAKMLAKDCEAMIVVGGKNSANTLRLVEIGLEEGCEVFHVETASELEKESFTGVESVVVTAGASTPVSAVEEVVAFLQ